MTKFGKVVSGQDMDATIDMKRHDSNFTRRTSPEDGRPRGPVVVGANWRGRRPGTTLVGRRRVLLEASVTGTLVEL